MNLVHHAYMLLMVFAATVSQASVPQTSLGLLTAQIIEASTNRLATGVVFYYRDSSNILRKRVDHISATTWEEHRASLKQWASDDDDSTKPANKVLSFMIWPCNQQMLQGGKAKLLRRAEIELPKVDGDRAWLTVEIESLREDQVQTLQPYLKMVGEFNQGMEQGLSEAHPQVQFHEAHSCLAYRTTDKALVLIGNATWANALVGEGYTEFHMAVSTVSGEFMSGRCACSMWPYEPGNIKQLKKTYAAIEPLIKSTIRSASAP